MNDNTTGDYNVGIGNNSLGSNTTGIGNIAFGLYALSDNISGDYNVGIGNNSLRSNTTGISNIAFGLNALSDNISGMNNIAIGQQALDNNTIGSHNIALGNLAMIQNTEGGYNLAMGQYTLYENTTGSYNLAFGRSALNNNLTGEYNIAFGYFALQSNAYGDDNMASGRNALSNNTTGDDNVGIGRQALFDNTQGNFNIAIGALSGNNITTGSRNIFIGYNIQAPAITSNEQLVIGNMIYGTGLDGTGTTYSSGNVGIKNNAPSNDLQVGTGTGDGITIGNEDIDDEGAFILEVDAAWRPQTNGYDALGAAVNRWSTVFAVNGVINTSDKRLKKNISELTYGLDEVLKLNPVSFEWNDLQGEGTKIGLLAQDLQSVIPEVVKDWEWVYEGEDRSSRVKKETDILGVYYSDLIPVLIKAIQEQNDNVEQQTKLIQTLIKRIEELEKE